MVGFAIADNSTAVHGFAAIGYALLHRERTGEGQHIDIAMADVMFHMQDQLSQYSASGGAFHPNRVGRHHPLYCPIGTYELADGYGLLLVLQRLRRLEDIERWMRWVALAAVSLAVIGLVQYFAGNGRYLWIYEHPFRSADGAVKGPFVNQNHFAHFGNFT